MAFCLYSFLWISCIAVGICKGENLQGEIEDYLRSLTEQQPVYHAPSIPEVLESLPPYPSLRLSKFTPSGSEFSVSRSLSENDKISPHLWPGLPPSKGGKLSFSTSPDSLKNPEVNEMIRFDTKAIAFSSVRDVQNEELLNDNIQNPTNVEPEKKSPQPVQQSSGVSQAMARSSVTVNHDSEVIKADDNFSDVYFVAIVAGCCAAGIFGVISAGFCFYRLQKNSKAAAEVDYPAYGVTGPSKDTTPPNGDRKLAQSAQMYHYQHQKQQMIAVEKAGSTKNASASDVDTEEENEEGDYTVYECPGLAHTGEMEVKNPLFNDDSTPMSPTASSIKHDEVQAK